MKLLSISLLALLLIPFAAQAATITGTVTSDTSTPLASMTVTAYTTTGALAGTTTTSASGAYSLTVPAGTYHLLAYDAAGVYATSFYADAESFETSASVTVSSSQTLSNINFHLVHAGYVAGHITAPSGVALANITVAAYNLDGTRRGFAVTDASGGYSLALPPGSYRIAAYDEALAWATTFFTNVPSFNSATIVSLTSAQTFTANIELPQAAKITGTISDLAPLAGMRVVAYNADGTVAGSAITGSDGRYAMAVRAGSIRIVVDDPNGLYAATYVPNAESFSAQPPMDVVASRTYTVDAKLVVGGRLNGRVSSSTNGAPIANMIVAAYNLDGTIRAFTASDASGIWSLILPPGDYRLGVFDPALVYLSQFYSQQSSFNDAVPVHVNAQQAISGYDFSIAKAARISGHVTTRSGGPISGATVAAYDVTGHLLAYTTTDANGAYGLTLPAAAVKLLAFDSAFRYATTYFANAVSFATAQTLSLTEGGAASADLVMSDAGVLTGSVTDAATASALAGMQVYAYDANSNAVAETSTDSTGAFRFALATGTYTIAAADPSGRHASAAYAQTVSITAGGTFGPVRIALGAASTPPATRHRAVRH